MSEMQLEVSNSQWKLTKWLATIIEFTSKKVVVDLFSATKTNPPIKWVSLDRHLHVRKLFKKTSEKRTQSRSQHPKASPELSLRKWAWNPSWLQVQPDLIASSIPHGPCRENRTPVKVESRHKRPLCRWRSDGHQRQQCGEKRLASEKTGGVTL